MATIRDVVEALARRGGVDAVVVVGRDGLPIDSRAANGVDAENVAALLPSVINGLAQLGEAGGRGPFGTGVLEFGSGLAVVSVLNADALLIVLCGRPPTWAPCSTTCAATVRRSPACSDPESPALSPVRRHLLVVDDEPHIGLLLRPHLERLGYVVTLARTLAEARRALQGGDGPFDAMLLDLHLPDGSGLELLRELRSAAATRAFPVIVLTAEGEDRILGEAEGLGAGLLTKPFSPSKLTARIAAMLGDSPPPPPPPSSVPRDTR